MYRKILIYYYRYGVYSHLNMSESNARAQLKAYMEKYYANLNQVQGQGVAVKMGVPSSGYQPILVRMAIPSSGQSGYSRMNPLTLMGTVTSGHEGFHPINVRMAIPTSGREGFEPVMPLLRMAIPSSGQMGYSLTGGATDQDMEYEWGNGTPTYPFQSDFSLPMPAEVPGLALDVLKTDINPQIRRDTEIEGFHSALTGSLLSECFDSNH